MAEILGAQEMFFTSFEPKVKNRFIMYINDIPAFLIYSSNRPTITFETITLDHINIKRKLQGKGEWQDFSMNLYDPIVPSAAQAVMEWVRLGHESLTGRRGYADFYKKDFDLVMLGPVGDHVEKWKIHGAFIQQANFGDVNWSEGAAFANVEVTIAYDYAVLEF
jgi:hypothetical protein